MPQATKRPAGRPKLPITKAEKEDLFTQLASLTRRVHELESEKQKKYDGFSDSEFTQLYLFVMAATNAQHLGDPDALLAFVRNGLTLKQKAAAIVNDLNAEA